jgi:protein O-mannosyl-transferase
MSRPIKKPISNPTKTTNSPQIATKSSATSTESVDFLQNSRLHAWIIFAVSILLYVNTLGHDFCQDDSIVITENMFTTQGVSGFGGILGNDTFFGFFKEEGKQALVSGGRYRPFTLLMFAFEYQIFGKNPFIGHLVNVLLFAGMCVLIYFLLLKLLKNKQNTEGSLFELKIKNEKLNAFDFRLNNPALIAFITALIFAAHPIHTEAVANIKGRDEIMTLFGSLSAVWFAIKFYENKEFRNAVFAFICFFIGLMSKENAITFVVIVPLIFYFFYHLDLTQSLKQVVPFMGAAILFILIRGAIIGQQYGGEQPTPELMNNPFLKLVGNQYVPFEIGEKLATIIFTLGKYIQLLFVPFPLTHDYYPRHIDIMNFGNWEVLLSLVLYLGLAFLMIKNWSKRSLISFGIAYFLITLSIVSNIVFPVGTNMAERFAFMPSLGFCLIFAILIEKLAFILRGPSELKIKNSKLNSDNNSELKNNNSDVNKGNLINNVNFSNTLVFNGLSDMPKGVLMALSIVFILFSFKTIDRNAAWKDNYTIFTTDINVSKNSAKLQNSVGGETIEHFKNEPNKAIKDAKMKAAISHILRATEIHPTYKNPYLLLGNAYFYSNDFEKSIQAYEAALKLDPNYRDAKQNLQLVYRDGGKFIAQQQNNLPRGIEFMQKALEMNPKDVETLSLLGTAYGISQQPQKSIEVLERALALRFDRNDAQNLSVAYRQLGNFPKAIEWENKLK